MSPRPLSGFAMREIAKVQAAVAGVEAAPSSVVPATLGPDSPLRSTPRLAQRRPLEEHEQIALFEVIFGKARAGEAYGTPLPGLPKELATLYAIPNAGKRSRAVAGRMKASGLREGFPDLCLPIARGGFLSLYVEFKRTGGETPRPEQRAWLAALAAEGHAACHAKGFDAALALLLTYIRISTRDVGETHRTTWRAQLAQIPGIGVYTADGVLHG